MSDYPTSSDHDARVLGLIGSAHFVSHFHSLTLPPLFPFLHAELGLGFTQLGLIMTLFAAATGLAQVPVGFLVDRVGARGVLTAGLVVLSIATGGMGFVTSSWELGTLAIVAGVANSVFHPSDYSILSASVDPARMGRAFSLHTFAGHLGSALAPVTIIALAVTWSWRIAMLVAGALGLVIAAAFLISARSTPMSQRENAHRPENQGDDNRGRDGLGLLLSPTVMALFLFFVMTSVASSGIQSFSVTALATLFDTPLVAASAALTGYLFASALGILLGGVIADHTAHHDRVAASAFVVTAVLIAVVGSVTLPAATLIILFSLAGLGQGVVRPARDMMVRAASPPGSSGKVFGFVTTGINVGGALTPVLFGWVIDQGSARWVFWLIAAAMIVALATVVTPGRVGGRHREDVTVADRGLSKH